MVVEEPRRSQGVGKSGKAYDVTSRRIQIFTGNKLVDCTEKLPAAEVGKLAPEFSKVEIMKVARFRITNVRVYNNQPTFDISAI